MLEDEAEQRLRDLGQITNYLSQWTNVKPISKHKQQKKGHLKKFKEEESHIQEQHLQDHEQKDKISPKAVFNSLQRANTLTRMEYPLENRNLFQTEEKYILPKLKVPNKNEIYPFIRKRSISQASGPICQIIEKQIIKNNIDSSCKYHLLQYQDYKERKTPLKNKAYSRQYHKSLKIHNKLLQEQHKKEEPQKIEVDDIKKLLRRQQRLSLPDIHKGLSFNNILFPIMSRNRYEK